MLYKMPGGLRDYKNIHKDEDIYVIGSGSSCNFIDESFFKNKITIGINQVYKKYKTQYLIRKEFKLISDALKNTNDTIMFISRGDCGELNNINYDYINKNHPNNKNIIVFDHNKNNIAMELNTLRQLNENQLIVSHSTITSGIYLASYMGAKNIILVGHDCGTIDGQSNFTGYHTEEFLCQTTPAGYNQFLTKIERDTIILKMYLNHTYNCNVYSLNPFVSFRLEGHDFKR
jgi:hypothetical protein